MRHFTDQEIEDATKKTPRFIQDEVNTGEGIAVAIAQIGQKYELHIDKIGTLAELNRNMLLGLVGPDDFLKELIAIGITDKNARAIMFEINEKIFVPLRKEEELSSETPKPLVPMTPVPSTPKPEVRSVAPEVRPSPESPKVEPQIQKIELKNTSNFNLENKIPVPKPMPRPVVAVPAPAPKKDWSNLPPAPMKGTLPPKEFLPRPVGAQSAVGPKSSLGDVVRSVLAAPKPVDASKLLEDHEESAITFHDESQTYIKPVSVIPEAPIPEVRPSPILKVEPQIQIPIPEVRPQEVSARPAVAPENLPGVMMEPFMPEAPIVPKPVIPEVQQFKPELAPEVRPSPESPKVEPQMQKPALAPITSYPSDPYREPIDEVPGN